MVRRLLARERISLPALSDTRCTLGGFRLQTIVKIPQLVFEAALADLHRPHPFAAERVGFFSTKVSRGGSLTLIHCVSYHAVSDADYIRDDSVGARIGSEAITEAMSRCAANRVGQFHVHAHGGRGTPRPSIPDLRESPQIARSFWNVNRTNACGWAILTNDSGWTSVLASTSSAIPVESKIAIIGSPLTVNPAVRLTPATPLWWRRLFRKRRVAKSRYDRQSFLGTNSDEIIPNLRVGIVGIGGGGSHIAQQLAHLGVCHFVLCDGDAISESNLNRTVGATEADVDRHTNKAAIAKRQIRGLHPNADIVIVGKWQTDPEALLHCDIIVGCVDTFAGRRDLEAFCRRHLIPYVDVGMDVQKISHGHDIFGQVILSMPGRPCMHCMGFLTEGLLAEEARGYGAAGARPQVVFANGVICSAAVGVVVNLVTGWSGNQRESVYLNFRGSDLSLRDDPRLRHLPDICEHYPLLQAGDATWTSL